MTRLLFPLAFAPLLAACSSQPEEAASDPEAVTEAAANTDGVPTDTEPDRAYRYTSLEDCQVVEEQLEEMPYVETLCTGPASWKLRVTDSDARQNLFVVTPSGDESNLDLHRIGGGGFSSLGERAEWRGPDGEPFAPDSLIVRYQVAEAPYPEPETSYLLAIRLAGEPCVIAKVAPGAGQNAEARREADAGGVCIVD